MKYLRISNELPEELVNQLTIFIKGFGGKYDAGIFLLNDKSFKNLLMGIKNKFVNIKGISLGKLIELNKVHMKDIVEVEKDPYIRKSELQKTITNATKDLVIRDEMQKTITDVTKDLVTRDELQKTIKDVTKDLVTRDELYKTINEATKDLVTRSELNKAIEPLATKNELKIELDPIRNNLVKIMKHLGIRDALVN
ncbi:MAG: hypothetical protein LBT17_00200 [Mycoplasmataceae bacterium]|jgi:hypothetical protein|nr:hypothetical protein [Mycoplasmataceae bacterium]